MKDAYQLSKREQRVMDLLWEKEALTSVDLLEQLSDIMPNATYVHRTINSLLDAGFIQECGSVRHRTQYARKFTPCMTREEYAAKYLVRHGIQRKSFGKVAMALFNETQDDQNKHTGELIAELEEIIDQLKLQAENEK
ncbi:MAG: BlaI/MecI/CopY family transcriptional regulator [Lachnospiraceae bacterium]|nr:BlaI/MecI/CopY family transcriptional regulator [Lachnospiraceae bacterium]